MTTTEEINLETNCKSSNQGKLMNTKIITYIQVQKAMIKKQTIKTSMIVHLNIAKVIGLSATNQ